MITRNVSVVLFLLRHSSSRAPYVPRAMLGRPLAHEALHHSWILAGMAYTDDELWYPPEDDKGRGMNEGKGHSDDEASIGDEPDGDLIMTRRHSS